MHAVETRLRPIADRVRWLATAMVDHANRVRPNPAGLKVGGHQASSASMVEIMVALWFHALRQEDRVAVKPHASPVLHAINYLLGDLDERYMTTLRQKGGLQSYPSRTKDPDTVDFSTGSVGIGATAPVWAAIAHRYLRAHDPETPEAGRFISLVGDAELDEGAIWEALGDPAVSKLGELLWVVDLNRQSLDRVVPDIQSLRLQRLFEAQGWEVITLKWGTYVSALFGREGGDLLRLRLETMGNEEYQRMLRADAVEVRSRLLGGEPELGLAALVDSLSDDELARAVRDLGGHDLGLLVETFDGTDRTRPTVVLAYTVKGRDLPVEGHPANHSALLSEAQMIDLAARSGMSLEQPWQRFGPESPEGELCAQRRTELARQPFEPAAASRELVLPVSRPRKPISTQAAFGRFVGNLRYDAPEIAERVVTCSPDVASSTNLGGWINKTGVWSVKDRLDWFADEAQRVLRWQEGERGQHIELGIAEGNLVGLLAELGSTWSRWNKPLIPIGVLYDPFVTRALEPWSYGMYAGGQSILVGTPSGVTLAPEGGAHQSIMTPSVGLEQPGCIAWEPAFASDLEWCLMHAMSRIGAPGGTSAYFRLSTRAIDQNLARLPQDEMLLARRRKQAIAGGYRLSERNASTDEVTLVGAGAIMPEVLAAAETLEQAGVRAGVVCLTSPDLVFRSLQQRGRIDAAVGSDIISTLFPSESPAPLVTVQDGHPHTLSFLAGARGDRVRNLGVTEFGQSTDLADAYALHGIDAASIVDAAFEVLGR
ncbi:transketolase-like TK C-terminal-containing protein [Leucobacter sp. gxy201]|uniref:transketolase-like TK C-terminal-containing protein n=1 Tax=Leucobacter sp. gxy201 TaxID=2957200 RepID=UPI003DA08A54